MFGDHGVMLKGGMHYSGCTRVPLLMHVPGIVAGVSDGLISSIDIGPTLLAQAGLAGFHGMQGANASEMLTDPSTRVRDQLLIEEDQMADLLGVGVPLRMRTLVTEDARLTLYQGYEGAELFDLHDDPEELNNLDPGSVTGAEMMARLARALMRSADESPKPTAFA
jgi:arylsulfatase A-like enzyme